MGRRTFLAMIAALVLVIGLLPVATMLVKSVLSDGRLSLIAYDNLLTSARQWTLLGHSMILATSVTLLTMAVGVPLGVILGKSDLPGRQFLTVLFVVPLLIPPYIMAVSWSDLLGRTSLLGHWVTPVFMTGAADLLFGLPGCVFILFVIFLPLPMLLTMILLRTINPRLEEAGRLAGGWGRVLREITLPMIRPGLLLAGMLVFLLSCGEFSVPNYLRYDVFPVECFTQFSAFYNFQAATAAAIPLAVITGLLLLLEGAFLREKTYQLHPAVGAEHSPLLELGRWRVWILGGVLALALTLVVAPLGVLVLEAGGPAIYAEALRQAGDSLLRSIGYATVGATLLSLLGFFTGYLIHTKALVCWRFIDSVTIFLFALPGTVIGIGLISLWNTRWTNIIYSTPLIIIFGYVAKYTALTSRISVAQLAKIPPSMNEAARMAGAGWARRMAFITVPMVRRGLVAGWLVGYIFSLRDTGITMLVYPPGHETLPVRIFTLMANGSPPLIAAVCVIMIIATILPPGLLWLGLGRIKQRGNP